jgi:uncharacterized SAM-binding protein YcdF (DUF218 family)
MTGLLHELSHWARAIIPILLIPPVGLLWVILLGLALARSHPRTGVAIAGLGAAALFALSLPVVGGALIASLETGLPTANPELDPGAIIVLGGDGDRVRNATLAAEPGALSLQRLAGAAKLTRKTGLPVLITGGPVGPGEPPVADIMADTFDSAFGLPVEWREARADNTCENARYSAEILRRAGIGSALVVTHAWHMRRAILAFEQAGYPIVPAPLPPGTLQVHGMMDFMPHTQAWIRSFYALHEWVGLIGYRMGACPRTDMTPPGPP